MAYLFDTGIFSAEGLAGEILVGATLNWYAAGTSTPLATYSDSGLSVANANPVVAGADGRWGPIWLQDASYKYVLKNAAGTTLVTRDNIVTPMSQLAASTGSSLVTFLQSGTGAVARNAQAKMRETATPLDFGATGNDTADDTAELQALFAAKTDIDLGGEEYTYKISSAITVQSGTRIRGRGAKIRQTTDLTSIFDLTGETDITIDGVRFEDTGSGYVTNDGSPHAAVFGGTGTARVSVRNCDFTEVTYAAIRFRESVGLDISNNTIVGPGVATLPASSELRCYGILIDADCEYYRVNFNEISETTHAIRLERSRHGESIGNVIHDIPAQHGFYVGAAIINLAIAGNTITGIALQGIKVQVQNAYDDCENININGNVIQDCGDSGITLSNGAGGTAQSGKIRNATIDGNTVADCGGTGIIAQNVVGASITDNTIANSLFSGISYSACDYLTIDGNRITESVKSGIKDQSASTNVSIEGNKLHNVATGAVALDKFGIFVQDMTAHSILRNRVTSSAGGMEFAFNLSGGDQTTCSFAYNEGYGATAYALSIASSVTAFALFKDNILSGTSGAAANNPALPSVASAATLVLPTAADVVLVTGTTNITTITSAGHTGHRVTLAFDGVLTVTRGNNVYAASNFVTSDKDTITFICDGTNWLELSRSAN